MITLNCLKCGKEFGVDKYREKTAVYCSKKCMHSSKEYRLKISELNPGNFKKGITPWNKGKHPEYMQGENNPMFGKKHTKEALEKMSKTKKELHFIPKSAFKKGGNTGELNFNWKGGVTPVNQKIRASLEYKLWRTAVFERDNYTCIWCGDNKGGNLEADHIKPFYLFPELRFAIDNGRTLCHKCHQTTETYGGRKYGK